MSNGPVGITFRETMRGGFVLGVTEPAEGRERGQRAGSELALHADVVVPDVKAFFADADRTGKMTGTLELTGGGPPLQPAGDGVFNLFKPSGQPSLKLMVYELPCLQGGAEHYLAGQKTVRGDPLDVWNETTTLYTRLHRGRDASGPVVGAGVIQVSVAGLIGVVTTLRAIGAPSPDGGAKAVEAFGRFFLGELWDSYVQHRPPNG